MASPTNTEAARDTEAYFHYYPFDAPAPPPIYVNAARDSYKSHDVDRRLMRVRDLRSLSPASFEAEEALSLDTAGIALIPHHPTSAPFDSAEQIAAHYYPEVEKLVKDLTHATQVHIFDHVVRRSAPGSSESTAAQTAARGPLYHVHVDSSPAAAAARIAAIVPGLPASARTQILNVWRPLRTVERDPLAVCDARSVRDEQLVRVKLVYDDHESESLAARWAEGHRWWYVSGQTRDELLVFRIYDSAGQRGVCHSAFVLPGNQGGAGRESIEVRCVVVFDGAEGEGG
ncbi:MAG: hypothetical protein M1829_006003 [Trizodia sp. TS-e1964]|nr:MAG: hypothetical protein M1829_006003 [Trizodia sp. TS-e1964]